MKSDMIVLERFITGHPSDAARVLERMNPKDTATFLKEIPNKLAVCIFNQLERYTAIKCLELLDQKEAVEIVVQLPLHVVSVITRRVSKELSEAILKQVPEEIAAPMRRMLNYPKESAGALADPLVLSLPQDITIKEALQRLYKRPEKAMYYLYVTNREQILTGVINMRELMLARPSDLLSAVMHTNVESLSPEINFQAILNHPGWDDYHALPVMDNSSILLGVIRYETLRKIEKDSQKRRLPRHALNTSAALGDLYKIGLTGLVRSITVPQKNKR